MYGCLFYDEQTKCIDTNGFHPIWNEKFPRMCHIYFTVLDSDTLLCDDRMAHLCASIKMIRIGKV